jgi:hypothetical protein
VCTDTTDIITSYKVKARLDAWGEAGIGVYRYVHTADIITSYKVTARSAVVRWALVSQKQPPSSPYTK